jgi:phosphoribosylformylglycinamidine synthase subunit PurL
MPITKADLKNLLNNTFSDDEFEIIDLAGDNDHYEVRVSSSKFNGMNKIAQHKMVYDALEGCVGTTLHALALKTSVKE